VVLPQCWTVANSDVGDTKLPAVIVEQLFHFGGDGGGTFIHSGKLGFMIEETSHSQTLLLPEIVYLPN